MGRRSPAGGGHGGRGELSPLCTHSPPPRSVAGTGAPLSRRPGRQGGREGAVHPACGWLGRARLPSWGKGVLGCCQGRGQLAPRNGWECPANAQAGHVGDAWLLAVGRGSWDMTGVRAGGLASTSPPTHQCPRLPVYPRWQPSALISPPPPEPWTDLLGAVPGLDGPAGAATDPWHLCARAGPGHFCSPPSPCNPGQPLAP